MFIGSQQYLYNIYAQYTLFYIYFCFFNYEISFESQKNQICFYQLGYLSFSKFYCTENSDQGKISQI